MSQEPDMTHGLPYLWHYLSHLSVLFMAVQIVFLAQPTPCWVTLLISSRQTDNKAESYTASTQQWVSHSVVRRVILRLHADQLQRTGARGTSVTESASVQVESTGRWYISADVSGNFASLSWHCNRSYYTCLNCLNIRLFITSTHQKLHLFIIKVFTILE